MLKIKVVTVLRSLSSTLLDLAGRRQNAASQCNSTRKLWISNKKDHVLTEAERMQHMLT